MRRGLLGQCFPIPLLQKYKKLWGKKNKPCSIFKLKEGNMTACNISMIMHFFFMAQWGLTHEKCPLKKFPSPNVPRHWTACLSACRVLQIMKSGKEDISGVRLCSIFPIWMFVPWVQRGVGFPGWTLEACRLLSFLTVPQINREA